MSSLSGSDNTTRLEVQLLESKYPGISEHADEVVAFAKQKGLSTEDAYLAKYGRELLSRSRDEVLREAELKSAATQQTTARVSADGNGNQDPSKKRETVRVSKSNMALLERDGINVNQYVQVSKALGGSIDIDTLMNTFHGKSGTKKG